jgi:FAD/FMN-containing dehydrogenase
MTFNPAAIESLRRRFGGEVITRADGAYETARRVWNGAIDGRPALVVRPRTPDDVATAVLFGRDNELVIATRIVDGIPTTSSGSTRTSSLNDAERV